MVNSVSNKWEQLEQKIRPLRNTKISAKLPTAWEIVAHSHFGSSQGIEPYDVRGFWAVPPLKLSFFQLMKFKLEKLFKLIKKNEQRELQQKLYEKTLKKLKINIY